MIQVSHHYIKVREKNHVIRLNIYCKNFWQQKKNRIAQVMKWWFNHNDVNQLRNKNSVFYQNIYKSTVKYISLEQGCMLVNQTEGSRVISSLCEWCLNYFVLYPL